MNENPEDSQQPPAPEPKKVETLFSRFNFAGKNIFQLRKILRRSIRAVREWNKPRFDPQTEGAFARAAHRTIAAQNAVPAIEAAVAELNSRIATPCRCALPKKEQRKLGLLPPVAEPAAAVFETVVTP